MNLGLIGNCRYSALIDDRASLKWLCWPRFDSSSIFGSLLDERAGHFSIQTEDGYKCQQSYLPNTNVLKTHFVCDGNEFEVIDFAPRFRLYDRTYSPTQFYRIIKPIRGKPRIGVSCQPRYDYGKKKPTFTLGSNHISFQGLPNKLRLTTNASLSYIEEESMFNLDRTLYLALTWGSPLEDSLELTAENFLKKTVEYWQTWVKHCRIPREFQDEVIRSALVLKLHQFEDTGAITAATTTSLPEYKDSGRNWDYRYCWLRDAYFSLAALEKLGHFEEMERFVDYLQNIALIQDDARLQPVYSITREEKLEEIILEHLKGYKGSGPVRIGNDAYTHIQNDIYGEMLQAISPLFLDRRFLMDEEMLPWELLERLLNMVETTMHEPDAGLWEFRGTSQLHTFTLLFHWLGAKKVAQIAERFGRDKLKKKALALEAEAKRILDDEIWDEKTQSYPQAKGSKHMDASLLALINLGYLEKDSPKAQKHLEQLEKTLLAKHDLVYRYNHADDFGKPEVTFTICSFWYVEALARLGHKEKAKKLFSHYMEMKNHVGLFSEDIHPETLEQWGNFPQTYSHVGLINAAFQIALAD